MKFTATTNDTLNVQAAQIVTVTAITPAPRSYFATADIIVGDFVIASSENTRFKNNEALVIIPLHKVQTIPDLHDAFPGIKALICVTIAAEVKGSEPQVHGTLTMDVKLYTPVDPEAETITD